MICHVRPLGFRLARARKKPRHQIGPTLQHVFVKPKWDFEARNSHNPKFNPKGLSLSSFFSFFFLGHYENFHIKFLRIQEPKSPRNTEPTNLFRQKLNKISFSKFNFLIETIQKKYLKSLTFHYWLNEINETQKRSEPNTEKNLTFSFPLCIFLTFTDLNKKQPSRRILKQKKKNQSSNELVCVLKINLYKVKLPAFKQIFFFFK